jgi:AcrR family transcriptional regulator
MTANGDLTGKRKQQILDAAMVVFARSGFHKARMDDIVSESGWSKGTLYWYFKSKDEIISAVIENFFTQELDRVVESLDTDLSVKEKLLTTTKIIVTDLQRIRDLMPIAIEYISQGMREKNIENRLKRYFRSYVQALTPVIKEGIEKGEIRHTNAEDAVIAYAAIIEGTILLWMYDPETINLEENMMLNMNYLIEGLESN